MILFDVQRKSRLVSRVRLILPTSNCTPKSHRAREEANGDYPVPDRATSDLCMQEVVVTCKRRKKELARKEYCKMERAAATVPPQKQPPGLTVAHQLRASAVSYSFLRQPRRIDETKALYPFPILKVANAGVTFVEICSKITQLDKKQATPPGSSASLQLLPMVPRPRLLSALEILRLL